VTASLAEMEWKILRYGKCSRCQKQGQLQRHHVYTRQLIRREHRLDLEYDLRNGLDLGAYCPCHGGHHSGVHRLPARLVPDSALLFGLELVGSARAAAYIRRYYAGDDPRLDEMERA